MKKILMFVVSLVVLFPVLSLAGPTSAPVYIVNPTNEVLISGQKIVTTAGTAVSLGTSKAVREILIQAKRTNTGRIYIGPSTVTNNDTQGIYLNAGDDFDINHTDMTTLYINGTVNSDGVTYLAW